MKNTWKSLAAGAALIILLTVIAYYPAIHGGFVFDDSTYITDSRLVKADDGLYQIWFTTALADYYPLTSSLWWFQWRWWGARPLGYHVVNVLLHAANAVLVWIVLKRLKVPGAWVAGLVFAVHPVNVATVAWISELKNTLSMFWCVITILLYLRFEQEARWRWYVLSLAAFLLALLSKIACVMLPFVLLGCVRWRRKSAMREDLLHSAPFFALSLVLGFVEIWFNNRSLIGHTVRVEGIGSRLIAAGWVPWFYLSKALLPIGLTVIYPKWEINPGRWISYAPGMILISCLLILWWKRQTWGRPLLFGLGYFLVMLFPVLGFVDQPFYQYALVADHWQYYSIVGVIALAVAAGDLICRRLGERNRYWGTVASLTVLMFLGMGTWRRSRVYADAETLWRDNVAKNPNAWVAHNNLGIELARLGNVPAAIASYEKALQLKPNYAEARNNLGAALLRQPGKIEEAIGQLEQALWIMPDNAEAHDNLGVALVHLGKVQEAKAQWEQALRIKPDFAEAHCNLGNALKEEGKTEEAIAHYEQALRNKPDFAEAQYNLGVALVRLGRLPEAVGHWEQALRLKPDYPEAQYNLGVALARLGRLSEAVGHWEQALLIKPDFAEVHCNLGNALAQTGRVQEGIEHYEQALRLKPDYAEAQYDLGVALVRLGRLPEAMGHWEKALQINPDYAEVHNDLGLALVRMGRLPEAMGHWEQALQARPGYPEAQNNLAWLLASRTPAEGGNPVRAVTLAERACELTNYRVAGCLDTLAVAYAATGRFKDAIAIAQKATELAKSAGQAQAVSEIEKRLELYRAGHPYRESATATSPHSP